MNDQLLDGFAVHWRTLGHARETARTTSDACAAMTAISLRPHHSTSVSTWRGAPRRWDRTACPSADFLSYDLIGRVFLGCGERVRCGEGVATGRECSGVVAR
jgi:hypothetical protein